MAVVRTVLGEIEQDSLGVMLGAEPLLRAAPSSFEKADLPAGDVAFALQPVTLSGLGRLSLGAYNLDDLTLTEQEALAALGTYAANGGGSVVVFAGTDDAAGEAAGVETLARLSRDTGVHLVRGTTDLAELEDSQHTVGLLGAFGVTSEGRSTIETAAKAAFEAGLALALDASEATLEEVETVLQAVDHAGLFRSRVLLTGATALIAAPVGVDEGKRDALIALGVVCCFDDLGRLPTVRTVVSDHDVALTTLAFAAEGAGDRVAFSSGIAQKHRLTAFGGNGLEFVPKQFLPYLRMFGADDALIAAVGGGNLAALLTGTTPAINTEDSAS